MIVAKDIFEISPDYCKYTIETPVIINSLSDGQTAITETADSIEIFYD